MIPTRTDILTNRDCSAQTPVLSRILRSFCFQKQGMVTSLGDELVVNVYMYVTVIGTS